ncbi:MAG: Crp/Fnr family transcriptional regulator [Flavobacteriales bacterium]|nr:Crp/Fnr family transcriptional regulator [Flavobacteriales bacterium]
MSKSFSPVECHREDCFLCRNISTDWLEMVRMKRSVISYKKGDVIFREGEEVKGIYFILFGKVKVDMSWGDKSYIVRLAGDGRILGHRGFGLDSVYPVKATALEDTTVCYIPTELFRTLLRTNPDFLYELTFFYADELKRTERRMKNLAHMPVKGRIAESLLYIDFAFGSDLDGRLKYRMSRKDMAAMGGTTYESVIRMLNELSADGWISLKDKDIWINEKEKLENCCLNASSQAKQTK